MTIKRTKSGKIDKRSKYYRKNGLKEPETILPAPAAPTPSNPPSETPSIKQIIERMERDMKTVRTMMGL